MMLVRIIGKQKALADEIIGRRGDRGDKTCSAYRVIVCPPLPGEVHPCPCAAIPHIFRTKLLRKHCPQLNVLK
jgi:hypothetical protein